MVDQDELTNAVGLNSASFNLARIVGPALAGLMIGALGGGAQATGWVILINAVSYAAPIIALQRMDRRAAEHPEAARAARPGCSVDGVRYVRSQPKMLMVLVAGLLRRHLRHELPDHLRADGHRGLRQGRRRSTACSARSWPSARSTGALLAARRVGDPAPAARRGRAWRSALAEIVAGLMPSYVAFAALVPGDRLLHPDHAQLRQRDHAAGRRTPSIRGRVMALYMMIVMGGTPLGCADRSGGSARRSAPGGP